MTAAMAGSILSKIKALVASSKATALDVPPLLKAAPFEIKDILASSAAREGTQVDDQTWKDLDLEKLAERIGQELSVTGQLFLHLRLRCGGTEADLARFRSSLNGPDQLADQLTLFANMRRARVNVCDPLFVSGFLLAPRLGQLTWIPIVLLFASLALVKFYPVAWLGIIIAVVFSAFVSIRLYLPMKLWHQQREVLLFAAATARLLKERLSAHIQSGLSLPEDHELTAVEKALKPTFWGRYESVAEYTNILFLTQYTEMHRQLSAVHAQVPLLRRLIQSISDFEADLGVLADAQQHGLTLSLVEPSNAPRIHLQGLRNPLLPSGAAVDIALGGDGLLLTGKNGIGKSTLLRTTGISVVMFRAFGAAYAAKAQVSCHFVMSSMRIDDSLTLGDSSHVAQAKRIRDMVEQISQDEGYLLLIDEVFNATNHIESVAAAVPSLARLASQAIVMVSTHNLILVPLLKGRLRAMKLEAGAGGARQVVDGVMGETNGIDVLEAVGFDAELVSQSRALAVQLEEMMRNPRTERLHKSMSPLTAITDRAGS
jgi:hypothetical protein